MDRLLSWIYSVQRDFYSLGCILSSCVTKRRMHLVVFSVYLSCLQTRSNEPDPNIEKRNSFILDIYQNHSTQVSLQNGMHTVLLAKTIAK